MARLDDPGGAISSHFKRPNYYMNYYMKASKVALCARLCGDGLHGALIGDSRQAGSGDASSTSVVAYGTASSRSFGIGLPDNSLTP